MASNTENLDLLMKNPSTDGADTFNVQTMLNENWQKIDNNAGTVAQTLANILKPTTPPIIGLPSSATPNDMFNALAHAGDLHVWRKTVVNSQAQDAYYSLGSIIATSGTIIDLSKQNVDQVGFRLSDSVMVLPDGSVSLVDPKMYYKYTYNSNMYQHRFVASDGTYIIDGNFSGKFISFYADSPSYYGSNYITLDKIYYIPATASFTYGAKLTISQLQPVIGHAAITAGTTTTYPVSTNRNAYQEGDDAKPAGYTLGEVVSGKYYLGNANVGYVMSYKTATSLSVSDNGILSMPTDATSFNVTYSENGLTTDQIKSYFAGKFVQLVAVGSTSVFSPSSLFKNAPSEILFIPSDSVITKDELKDFNIDCYQPVTGYAAIPANTTIEYLGCLGDKARVQVVSYVGTGTYGENNKNSLTFDFHPKILLIAMAQLYSNQTYTGILYPFVGYGSSFLGSDRGYVYSLLCNKNENSVSWWSENDYGTQLNISGYKYTAIAIG